ncbi:MAG: hypothetical protein DRP63_05575 [Planctomycetota bacterium]|nr:MAG: hypothetical protein DRP63_05575 [Planctomycetota bacterium]
MRVEVAAAVVVGFALCLGQEARRPEDLPLRWVDFEPPKPKRKTLKNGVHFYRLTDVKAPLVEVVVAFRGGAVADPQAQSGLAFLASRTLLTCGAGNLNAAQSKKALDDLGGTLRCNIARDYIVLRLLVLKEEFDKALALLSTVIKSPHFESETLEREKKVVVTIVKRWFEHSGNAARITALATLSPTRGKPLYGRCEDIEKLTRRDLLEWHRRFFVGANCVAGIAGCADETMVRHLEEMLESLPRGKRWKGAPFGWVKDGLRIVIVARESLEQVAMCVAWSAPMRGDPMRAVVEMVRYCMATRINLAVREAGLAYSAGASYVPAAAAFLAYARTKKEHAKEALTRLLNAARSVARFPPTEEAFSYIKNHFRAVCLHRFNSCFKALWRWMRQDLEGLGSDYTEKYRRKVAEADVNAFALVGSACAPLHGFVVVLVGEESACRAAANSLNNANITLLGGKK